MSVESDHQKYAVAPGWISGHTEANSESTVDFHEQLIAI